MKGKLHKTKDGWHVRYYLDEDYIYSNAEGQVLPLIDNGHIDGLKLYDSNEGLEIEFEIIDHFDNNGPEHFKKFAKIII